MIVEQIYEDKEPQQFAMSRGIIRMSQVEDCPRKQAYLYQHYPVDSLITGRHRAIFRDGHIHERDIVDLLISNGLKIWNYVEDQTTTYYRPEGQIFRGHPDLFAEKNGKNYGLEIKGYRGEVFEKHIKGAEEISDGLFQMKDLQLLRDRPWPLMGQIQMYLHSEAAIAFGVEEWILIMKNKNTAEYAECIIPKDQEYIDNLAAKWKGFWGLMQVGRLPERFFSSDSDECERCPFFESCWAPLKRIKDGAIEVEGLEKAASWRREGVRSATHGDLLKQAARLEFEKQHIKHEVEKVTIDGLTSKLSHRSREGLDSDRVKILLGRMVREEHITEEEYFNCLTETEYDEIRFTDRYKES